MWRMKKRHLLYWWVDYIKAFINEEENTNKNFKKLIKLSANTNQKSMTEFIFKSGFTGFYAKVLKEGNICQNDNVLLKIRKNPDLTIEKLNQLIINPMFDENLTIKALNCQDLGYQFLNSLKKRYELKDKDEQFSTYHTWRRVNIFKINSC